MAKRSSTDWLHLFTSTIRPLYISDALEVLASPVGTHIRFRYDRHLISPGLRSDWDTRDGLVGRQALVHFAIQHPAEFHLPSYVPVREARVVGNFVEGNTYIINFATGALRLPVGTRSPKEGDVGEPIRAYSDSLRDALGIGDPPRPSATASASVDGLLEPLPASKTELEVLQGADFEAAVKIFSQALYFSPRIFYRVARISTPGAEEPVTIKDGRLTLSAGKRYEIALAHYQTQQPAAGTHLAFCVPVGLTLLGDSDLDLPSRYDVIPVEVYAEFRDDKIEGQLEISVASPASGPTVRIPIVIKPSMAASVVAPSAGVAAGAASAVSSLLVSGQGLKIGLAAGGAALAGGAVMFRRARRLS
jgi:hypothetical protein